MMIQHNEQQFNFEENLNVQCKREIGNTTQRKFIFNMHSLEVGFMPFWSSNEEKKK